MMDYTSIKFLSDELGQGIHRQEDVASLLTQAYQRVA
jgi:hypothetical protein